MSERDDFPWHDAARWTPEEDAVISDSTAREIAAQLNVSDDSAIHDFASTGAVSLTDILPEYFELRLAAMAVEDSSTLLSLSALRSYLLAKKNRDAVEGWATS